MPFSINSPSIYIEVNIPMYLFEIIVLASRGLGMSRTPKPSKIPPKYTQNFWRVNSQNINYKQSIEFLNFSFKYFRNFCMQDFAIVVRLILTTTSINPPNAEAIYFCPFFKHAYANIFETKSCHVGIHWIAVTEYSPRSTNMPGFQ